MKAAASIFLTLFVVLTLQPAFGSSKENLPERKCCKKVCTKEKKEPKQKKDCEKNNCNPFMSCSSGNFYFQEKQFSLVVPERIIKQKFILSNDNRLATNSSKCWHPPELF